MFNLQGSKLQHMEALMWLENTGIFNQDFSFRRNLDFLLNCYWSEVFSLLKSSWSACKNNFQVKKRPFFFTFQVHPFSVTLTYRRAKQSNIFSLSMHLNTGEWLVKVLAVTRLQIMGKSLPFIWHPVKRQVSIQNVMDRMLKFSCIT